MNDLSRKKLLLYIESANKDISHPCDEDRFVDFVKTSHIVNDNSAIVAEELEEILESNRFTENMVRSLVSSYEFGRLLLS